MTTPNTSTSPRKSSSPETIGLRRDSIGGNRGNISPDKDENRRRPLSARETSSPLKRDTRPVTAGFNRRSSSSDLAAIESDGGMTAEGEGTLPSPSFSSPSLSSCPSSTSLIDYSQPPTSPRGFNRNARDKQQSQLQISSSSSGWVRSVPKDEWKWKAEVEERRRKMTEKELEDTRRHLANLIASLDEPFKSDANSTNNSTNSSGGGAGRGPVLSLSSGGLPGFAEVPTFIKQDGGNMAAAGSQFGMVIAELDAMNASGPFSLSALEDKLEVDGYGMESEEGESGALIQDAATSAEQMERFGHVHEFNEEAETNLRFDESGVSAASLTKLVEMITLPTKHDHNLVMAFFITCRSFTTPRVVLEKLILRYAAPPPRTGTWEEKDRFTKEQQPVIRLRVCNALRHWIEKHEYDFENKVLRKRFLWFAQNVVEQEKMRDMLAKAFDKAIQKLNRTYDKLQLIDELNYIKRRQETIVEKLKTFEEEPLSNPRESNAPRPMLPKNFQARERFLLDWHPTEIARQITLIEFDLFQRIQPKEFLNQSWNKQGREDKAPGICALIDRFNEMSMLMATSILLLEELDDRRAMLKKWILVAEECFTMNNFNALMEVVSGLNAPSLTRLSRTWDALSSKTKDKFRELTLVTATEKNFKTLRERVASAPPPKLPYIGTALADLTFIEEGNPDHTEEGLINFAKRQLLTTVIVHMQTYQQQRYNYMAVPPLKTYLLTHPLLPAEECYERSLRLEPRRVTVRASEGRKSSVNRKGSVQNVLSS
ncbi:RasGEF domain containing protein [Balamuthia mandrillaris]